MVSKGLMVTQTGKILSRFPRIKGMVSRFMFYRWQQQVNSRLESLDHDFDINKTIWVDPQTIVLATISNNFQKYKDRGRMLGGDWDLNTIPFADLDVVRGIRKRFVEGTTWQETAFYNRVVSEIEAGQIKWGCRTPQEFDKRCVELDKLYENMQKNGYRSQESIATTENPYKGEDEVSFNIGRHGDLLFDDGRHRMAIAQLLGIEQMPAKITVRHVDWIKLRKEICLYAEQHGGQIYHHIFHPDLQDIAYVHGNERVELMQKHLPISKGDMLDIGAHWGHFSHFFEKVGFSCYAVESNPKAVYFMQKLHRAQNRRFQIIQESIFDYKDKTTFDLVLAMNIFHHFLKSEEKFRALIELLNRLKMNYMFFQPHVAGTDQMVGAYRDFPHEEFVQFVLNNSNLKEAEYLGMASDKRPIYLLKG